jgi:hypothetical protein
VPVSLFASTTVSSENGLEAGTRAAFGVRTTALPFGGWVVTAGAVTVSRRGAVPTEACYEPRLPGEFGLATLSASGARWYIRATTEALGGVDLTLRLAGGPRSGEFDLGIAVEARG